MNRPRLVILGAGRAAEGAHAFGIQRVTIEGRILDWQVAAFDWLEPEVEFVGGYDISEVMREFPALTFHFNADWAVTGPVASLAIAMQHHESEGDLYIAYADVLMRRELVRRLSTARDGISAAIDRTRQRKGDVERLTAIDEHAEFVGVVRVHAAYVPAFRDAVLALGADLRHARLSTLLEALPGIDSALAPAGIEVTGLWAHAEHSASVAQFVLGTKAGTLDRLRGRLVHSRVLPLKYFTRGQWHRDPDGVLEGILQQLGTNELFVVRSSARNEDGFAESNAGRYRTELQVAPTREALHAAVERVFASYGSTDSDEEVLVQPELSGVIASGVAFTRGLSTSAPYRILSYVEGSDTTAITSGSSDSGVKLVIARNAPADAVARLPDMGRRILTAVEEIEYCVCHDALDVEFAVRRDDTLATLQVRPLIVNDARQDRTMDDEVADTLAGIHVMLDELDAAPVGQLGTQAIWSVMADWNPAEIIGLTPGPLAFDLYRYLITDRTWATQRQQVGYRDLSGWPLVRAFGGQAYVDVRASVNSFVPVALADATAARMVEDGLRRLRENPALHDKIEFEVIPTCIDFGFPRWASDYLDRGVLDRAEIALVHDELARVTRRIIGRSAADVTEAEALEKRCPGLESRRGGFSEWLRQVLGECRAGALTFSHLARAGFVAASLLRSAVQAGLISADRRDQLMGGITTVGSLMARAAWDVKSGNASRDSFIERFGHLRPGTYDISAPAYRDLPESFIDPIIASATAHDSNPFEWTRAERQDLDLALRDLPVGLDVDSMLRFIQTAVAGREYAKFVFTRLLSAALHQIRLEANRVGVAPTVLECLPLAALLDASIDVWGARSATEEMQSAAATRYARHRLASLIMLPPVLTVPDEIYAFSVRNSEPNFITNGTVRETLCIVDPGKVADRESVAGRIVAIRNADPGFDYLFAMGVKGLVTAYGGPNSHMAIRASEFRIPAVIGIGAGAFEELRAGYVCEIDCHKRRWLCGS